MPQHAPIGCPAGKPRPWRRPLAPRWVWKASQSPRYRDGGVVGGEARRPGFGAGESGRTEEGGLWEGGLLAHCHSRSTSSGKGTRTDGLSDLSQGALHCHRRSPGCQWGGFRAPPRSGVRGRPVDCEVRSGCFSDPFPVFWCSVGKGCPGAQGQRGTPEVGALPEALDAVTPQPEDRGTGQGAGPHSSSPLPRGP